MPESGTDTWILAPFTSSSSLSSLSLSEALIHSFSGHAVLLHGPDVGSEANKLGGSTQDSPCLLGPHGQGLCSDREAPGEAESSGRGSHRGLSIRGGGGPGSSTGRQPFTQSGGRRPCVTRCPGGSPCPGGLWAQPWMTRSLHLSRARGWH